MASNFPKLPGYVVDHDPTKVTHNKVSHVHLEKIRNHKDTTVPLYAVPQPPAQNFRADKTEASKSLSHTQFPNHLGGGKEIAEQFEPTFVKLDKQVLRFMAYSKESVVESRLENFRIRKAVIFYYLEDKSIMITEPKEQNSGVPQGPFLKRHMVLKSDGSQQPFMPTDFSVGLDIAIYGRVFRIYDADDYTRQFMMKCGQPCAEAQTCPSDSFEKSKVPIPPKRDAFMLQYLEKKLGGGKVASQKQFLDHDRKVLRFYCSSEDRPFVINYYLADDTVEVRETHHQNDGFDSFACLLRRQKLPDSSQVKQPGQAFIGDNYLTCDEIFPGGTISVFGHMMRVDGVDPYTQSYYHDKYQRHFELGEQNPPRPREPKPPQVPTHNGLMGGEQDSLGYIYKLVPDRPKPDFFKHLDNDKNILRFTARFNTRVPEDVDRRFIISFYLADDSIAIYEPEQKNSGIVSGKFLERRKYKNFDKGGEWLTPTDMPLGGDVKINGHNFHVLSCDDYTKKYLDGHLY